MSKRWYIEVGRQEASGARGPQVHQLHLQGGEAP